MKASLGAKLKFGEATVETVPVMRDHRNITEFTVAEAIMVPVAAVKLLAGT